VQEHAVYAGMVEAMDLARAALASLDDLDLAKNTLVIFTSDNGGLSTSELADFKLTDAQAGLAV
jgi:arylsulfatase A-like enzyme